MIDVLRRVDLFDDLSDACLERLPPCAREVELPAGEYLIREGEPVDRFAVLTEGTRGVGQAGGRRRGGRRLARPGHLRRRGALLTGDPSPASGRAVIDSRLAVVIDGADFRRLLHDEPSVHARRRCA